MKLYKFWMVQDRGMRLSTEMTRLRTVVVPLFGKQTNLSTNWDKNRTSFIEATIYQWQSGACRSCRRQSVVAWCCCQSRWCPCRGSSSSSVWTSVCLSTSRSRRDTPQRCTGTGAETRTHRCARRTSLASSTWQRTEEWQQTSVDCRDRSSTGATSAAANTQQTKHKSHVFYRASYWYSKSVRPSVCL